jgi:argininosuccinate lyase
MMLYTHGQHAQIGTFGHIMIAYVDTFLRDFQRLLDCYRRINRNPLGSGPIGGTSININRERTTELLGFDTLIENSIDASSGRDWVIEVVSISAILMSNLSRVVTDFINWSTKEFDYVELSDEYSSSSSIMPQKKNPSTLELIRGKTGEVYGALIELLTMVKGIPVGYYQDLQGTKPPLWRCLDTVRNCLKLMIKIISTIGIKNERMLERVKKSFTVALDLTEMLVEKKDLSFREAYRLIATLVKETLEKKKHLEDLTPTEFSEVSLKTLGKQVKINEKFIKDATDPVSSLNRRRSLGSPQPKQAKRMFRERKISLKTYKAELEEKKSTIKTAERRLQNLINKYLSS